jgi:alanine-glyoxylate transaminase/serine-glyoxylate transaminase/serine-pyruvate transaminase
MLENVKRTRGVPVIVDDAWGAPVDPQKVRDAFKANPDAKILAFVHAETSTGAQSDGEALAKIAQEFGALTIMDCVTSLGGTPLYMDKWGIDAAYSGSQKCLSCTPGLSPVSFSERAIERIKARTTMVQSWFLDLNLVLGYWQSAGKRTYHHTAPINPMYGLHEALVILEEEGLENAWARHRAMHEKLKTGLEAMGLRYVVEESARLPQLNSIYVPEGADDATVRARLLNEFNLEIGAGLGDMAGKIWRIGLMGYSAKQANVDYCLKALKACLS